MKDLLKERDINRALIVDDAYDLAPRAADLRDQADQWTNFFTDLSGEQRDLIDAESAETSGLSSGEKMADDRYVETVWHVRHQLGEVAELLFETYKSRQAADTAHVDKARKIIEGLGLKCETAGREFEEKAATAQLILIDLYLGGTQDNAALEESMKRLGEVVAKRKGDPPLVVLMSRSNLLHENRARFRDDVGLIESGFRILSKADLKTPEKLELQIQRLAESHPETLKLARFFAALENGISRAADRTLEVMRRLSLSDISQIQQLLLEAEEAPAGSYLVDVFDRVLQHEVERDAPIIDAALDLNVLTAERHPPAFVAGSIELQDVVQRTLTQAKDRLRLPGTPHSKVAFGDILTVQKVPRSSKGVKRITWPSGVTDKNVFLVLTPVCDLQHGSSPRVLLMVGELRDIRHMDWTYGSDARTPAIRVDGKLVWIKWDPKHVDTVSGPVLDGALADGRVQIAARLRDAHALELQQRLLSGLGRVGLLAAMPATFKVAVEAYVTDKDRKVHPLNVPELSEGGVVWVGRDGDSKMVRKFVLKEPAADALQDALSAIAPDDIAPETRNVFKELLVSTELGSNLTAGINISNLKPAKWLPVPRIEGAASKTPFAMIALNLEVPAELTRHQAPNAGVMLVLREIDSDAQVRLADVIRADGSNGTNRAKPKKAKRTPAAASVAAPQAGEALAAGDDNPK